MKRMMSGKLALAAAAVLFAAPAHAQFDPAVFAKWGSVEVLKFKLVQTYKAERAVIVGGSAVADVEDKIEIEFRWNQYESRLVGEPVIRNYPTVMSAVRSKTKGCPAATLSGTFEHATAVAAEQGDGPVLIVTVRTDYPAAQEPQMCSAESTKPVAAASEDQPELISPPGIALFGLKDGQMPNMTVRGDTLTITEDGVTNAWTLSKG